MAERFLRPAGHKIIIFAHQVAGGRPLQLVQLARQPTRVVVIHEPLRCLPVIAGRAPKTRLVVQPKTAIGGMTGTQHCCIAVGCQCIHESTPLGSNLQLVANGAHHQTGSGSLLGGLMTRILLVVDTEDRLQGLSVEPLLRHHPILVRRGATRQTRHCTGAVGMQEGVLRPAEHMALLHELAETVITIQRHEGLQIVAPQLVDNHTNHQAWHLGCHLSVRLHRSQQDQQGAKQLVSFCVHRFVFIQ